MSAWCRSRVEETLVSALSSGLWWHRLCRTEKIYCCDSFVTERNLLFSKRALRLGQCR